jgi:hypothetical protein
MENASDSLAVWVSRLVFTDGTTITPAKGDLTIFVGPNNSGKSQTLRDIRSKVERVTQQGVVLSDGRISLKGDSQDVIDWLKRECVARKAGDIYYGRFGHEVSEHQVAAIWPVTQGGLGALAPFFCREINGEARLSASSPPNNISIVHQAPQHPIHILQRDMALEKRFSGFFREAFGFDLIVHRNAGNIVPLYVGIRPKITAEEGELSIPYTTKIEAWPQLRTQGDGMRAFVGLLLYGLISDFAIGLIDEPEAFLHPPQARLLGNVLAREMQKSRQLFIATHSADVLKGILDANVSNVRIIRLQRRENVNIATELNSEDIKTFWNDPLLRHSNLLEGLFHERVLLCESDSDCRFYSAVSNSIMSKTGVNRGFDPMFAHCGGKDRMPIVLRSLTKIGVPVCAVVDFDVLRDEQPLRGIIESLGGKWTDIEPDWRNVKSAIDAKRANLTSDEVREQITAVVTSIKEHVFPATAADKIRDILKRTSFWSIVKESGLHAVPSGSPRASADRVLQSAANVGLFIVPDGQLESFDRTVSLHGSRWVNHTLAKNLAEDVALRSAREFVAKVILYPRMA